jgi:hypothetical protein
VLQEASGQLSFIRITDALSIAGPLKEMQPATITLFAVVGFKAGFAHGKYEIKVNGITPSKNEFMTVNQAVYFEGEDRGVNAIFVLSLALPEEGVYWFDVLLQDVVTTRMPLRVLYQQIVQGFPGAG